MKIAILGYGSLGRYFQSLLISTIHECSIYTSKDVFSSPHLIQNYDIIIDSLDPSSSSIPGYGLLSDEINKLRESLLDLSKNKYYIYISSVQVYRPSSDIIYEDSPTFDIFDELHPYIHNKIKNEKILFNKLQCSYVLRLPALWSDDFNINEGSFFSDLLLAKQQNRTLAIRDNDHLIISFLHYSDAASFILYFARNITQYKDIKVLNVTSSTWDSRHNLKMLNQNQHLRDIQQSGYKVSTKYLIFDSFDYSLYSLL